jgi:hypothetical protein
MSHHQHPPAGESTPLSRTYVPRKRDDVPTNPTPGASRSTSDTEPTITTSSMSPPVQRAGERTQTRKARGLNKRETKYEKREKRKERDWGLTGPRCACTVPSSHLPPHLLSPIHVCSIRTVYHLAILGRSTTPIYCHNHAAAIYDHAFHHMPFNTATLSPSVDPRDESANACNRYTKMDYRCVHRSLS